MLRLRLHSLFAFCLLISCFLAMLIAESFSETLSLPFRFSFWPLKASCDVVDFASLKAFSASLGIIESLP
jgi:hypothetical protein